MKKETMLWDAVAMVGEDLLTEAMEKPERQPKRQTKRQKKSVWILAAAAVVLVSFVGWAAKEWVFAPGIGMVGTDMLGNQAVYVSEGEVMLGNIVVESVAFFADPVCPENNRLYVWVYRDTEILVNRDGRIPEALKSMTATIDGIPYTNQRGKVTDVGYSCYSFIPEEIPAVQDNVPDTCSILLSDIQKQPVTLTLSRAKGQRLASYTTKEGMTMQMVSLTENLYVGSFADTSLEMLNPIPALTEIFGFYTVTFADGTTGKASGELYYDGIGDGMDYITLDGEFRGKDVVSLACVNIMYSMPVNGAPYVEFPLPEIGETVTPALPLYTIGDFTCVLEYLKRTERNSFQSQSVVYYTGDNPYLESDGGGAMLDFGCLRDLNGDGEMEYYNLSMEDDNRIYIHSESGETIEICPGENIVLQLESMDIGYRPVSESAIASFTFH